MEKELIAVMNVRQSLDSILKDMHKYIEVVVSVEKRVQVLEEQMEDLFENSSQTVSMYG